MAFGRIALAWPVLSAWLAAWDIAERSRGRRRPGPIRAERQPPDGTFGAMAQQERALISLRALLWGKSVGRAAPVFPAGEQV